jgi:DNA-binding SARP family transcriptional activator
VAVVPESAGITFAVLGPLEVRRAQRLVRLSGKQRAVLAVLLLDANRVVSRDRLIEALWVEPPRSAVANIQTHVSGLRRALTDTSSEDGCRLETRETGYCLTVAPDRLDLLVFAEQAQRSRELIESGDLVAAERELGVAVALWRGRPCSNVAFGDVPIPRLAEIEERFEQVWSDWIDVRLSLGDHKSLIGELRRAAQARPLCEPVWEQLIVALHGARRRGEALDAFHRARTTLVAELGVEPGPELRRLHAALLHDDPTIARDSPPRAASSTAGPVRDARTTAPVPVPVPDKAQPPSAAARASTRHEFDDRAKFATLRSRPKPAEVPRSIRGFIGRNSELAALDASLGTGPDVPIARDPSVWVISGTAGVGKTALAVHWTHRVADAFPDGHLHVALHGFDPSRTPTEPEAALAQLLTSLGVESRQIPDGPEAREKLYRSVIADRRLVLLLDDARTAEQVRPLLPGHHGAVVLVTSRFRLSDLVVRSDARALPLDALGIEESRDLLANMLGTQTLATEPGAVAELARLCGHLPLVLRTAGARIGSGAAATIADMVAELGRGDWFEQEDFDPIEEARAIERMVAELGSARAVAEHCGRHEAWVSQRRSLLRLSPSMQALVSARRMTVEQACDLAETVKGHGLDEQDQVAWSVRERTASADAPGPRIEPPADPVPAPGAREDSTAVESSPAGECREPPWDCPEHLDRTLREKMTLEDRSTLARLLGVVDHSG